MPRQRISAKYLGDGSRYFNGIPARDLTEDEFDVLTDDQKATLAADPPEGVQRLYELRHDAPAEAAKATRRVERAPDPLPSMAATALADVPHPDDGDKK